MREMEEERDIRLTEELLVDAYVATLPCDDDREQAIKSLQDFLQSLSQDTNQ